MINAIQLDTYFNRTLDRSVSTEKGTIDSILVHIFHMSNLSLRSIAQALHRFGLVYASLGNRSRALIAMATVALIIRTIDLSLYYRFIRNEVSDEDVINQINAKLIPSDTKHANVVFESLVIEAARNNHSYEGKDYSSPLLRYYQGLVEKANGNQ
ncbi:MAG: hypothetical protein F4Z88_07260 [Chloroflexi bacterium]|nr:hypothetical protein [Chloroflexota bacterium]